MGFKFWRRKEKPDIEVVAWNVMVAFTDPDRCWQTASVFRETSVPGSVLTCEMSFLMGSIVRDAIRTTFAGERQRIAIKAAESAYFKTFDDQSGEELQDEMKAVYHNARLGDVARQALSGYGENNDELFLTSSLFVNRIKGDPRMKYEIMPILEESQRSVIRALKEFG